MYGNTIWFGIPNSLPTRFQSIGNTKKVFMPVAMGPKNMALTGHSDG
jgi:hypothetical protein